MSIKEGWAEIPGYCGHYYISTLGRVISIPRTVAKKSGDANIKGRILKPSRYKNGYLFVVLCSDSSHDQRMIHHLVLESFVGKRPDGLVACHNDGDKENNDLSNLRWDTHANNLLDKIKHGTHQYGEQNHAAILTSKDVDDIKKELATGPKGIGRRLAKKYGVSTSTISAINVGKRWAPPPVVA